MPLQSQILSRLLALLLLIGGGLAGWFGRVGFEHVTANKAQVAPSVMVRGVELTAVMQDEMRIFRSSFHGGSDLNNPALRKDNDDFADQFLAKAIDNYKANPSAPFSAFLMQQMEYVDALSGGVPPSTDAVDAYAQLRAYRRAGH